VEKLMARPKKPPAEKKPKKDPRIEEIYEEEVEFMCPVRGLVKQKVKIKRFKPATELDARQRLMISINELTAKLEEADDGLSIYSDGEELGIADEGDAE
jgi:hypothetical protein